MSFRKSLAVISRQRQPPFHFIRPVRVHPVVKPRPLRIARIQFFVGELACIGTPPRLGCERFQHARPAAFGIFVTIGMQAGK